MKMIILTIAITMMLITTSFADPGDTLWTRTYGGSGNDRAEAIQQTLDGGYIIGGSTESFGAGEYDMYLVKIDSSGGVQWSRTYGLSLSDFGTSACQTADGGFIIVGSTRSWGYIDCYLVKTDSQGNVEWTSHYGGDHVDGAYSVQQTPDGGYIVAGSTSSYGGTGSDVYLLKYNYMGYPDWTAVSNKNGEDAGYSVRQTPDGGYIVAGYYLNGGWFKIYVLKTDSRGNIQRERVYGDGKAYAVRPTRDGGYAIAGQHNGYYLMKTNCRGGVEWDCTYVAGNNNEAYCVEQTADGGFILTGVAGGNICSIKTNPVGGIEWIGSYGGSGADVAKSGQQTSDGNYIFAGWTESYGAGGQDIYVVKVEGEGSFPEVYVNMTPDDPPIVVNPGGWFTFTAELWNRIPYNVIVDVLVVLDVPGVGRYGPIAFYDNVHIEAGQWITCQGVRQNVPLYAVQGDYEYIAYCGRYPTILEDSASFTFSVLGNSGNRADKWTASGWFSDDSELPSSVSSVANYPNPFNAVTTISYDLPATDHVRLDIYNLTGQMVETLTDGRMEAGHHSVQWDASSYSSGIYFYRLTAGDKVFTKRMTLLK